MRTSVKNCLNYYRKKDVRYLEEDIEDNNDDVDNVEEVINKPKSNNKPLKINLPNEAPKNNKISDNKRVERHNNKKEYLNDYYATNQDALLEKAKLNSKLTYGKRIARELNNNVMSFKSLQDKTIDKWQIKYNSETKLYYSNL